MQLRAGYPHTATGLAVHMQVCFITNPIWVVKTRLQLQRRRQLAALQAAPGPSAANLATPYRSFVHAVGHIAKHEGWQGFYRGLGPSLIMVRDLHDLSTV